MGGQTLFQGGHMQVNYIENSALTGVNLFRKTSAGESSQFQRLFEEKMAPGEKSALDGTSHALNDNRTEHRVCLGTITLENPTVSHLLYNSSHKEQCWDILARDVNAEKPFTRIPLGTPIFMDTQTSEIIWGSSESKAVADGFMEGDGTAEVQSPPEIKPPKMGNAAGINTDASEISSVTEVNLGKSSPLSISSIPGNTEDVSLGLDQAVGTFIGTAYSRMNCYELLVEGLERMGVQYRGAHGLSSHLAEQASREGLSSYSLHSGEGLTQAIGSDVFMESFPRVSSVNSQARAVMNKMSDVLQEGQILSFSTPTRGHTGVISKKAGNWTFINSGVMDHRLTGKNGGWEVGEERLGDEIKNWFRRAHKEGNGLTITLGAVDAAKLARFQQAAVGTLSQRV